MRQTEINAQFCDEDEHASPEQYALTARIASLKQSAFTLFQEVQKLGYLSFLDISSGVYLYKEVRRFEMRLILRALEEADGHQVRAARLLGINPTTLNSKLRRYGIERQGTINSAASSDEVIGSHR